MKGMYEIEQQVKEFLTQGFAPATEETVLEFDHWAKELNKYISSLSLDVPTRLQGNIKKYNAMLIQVRGLKSIRGDMMDPRQIEAKNDTPHAKCIQVIDNALTNVTCKLAYALT